MREWQEAIDRAKDWIEKNLAGEFTLQDLAEEAGYSPFYFSRLFRQATGTTLKKHIAERRLCRVLEDICETDERILDIAVKYGFSSQEALTRAFGVAYGNTPYAFRKNPHLMAIWGNDMKRREHMEEYLAKSKEILSQFTKTTGFSMQFVGINIVSSNPRRLADFYRDVLGAVIVDDKEHGGPNRIEIWFGERNENTTWITVNYDEGFTPRTFGGCAYHGFEFRVLDADVEYERILALGVEVKHAPKDVPWGYRYFGIKDPDGNTIDIVAAK